MDAQFVKNSDLKSIFTILVYLDDTPYGTNLLRKVELPTNSTTESEDGPVMHFQTLGTIQAKRGSVAVFNHDLYHEGIPVESGSKYVLRTEMVFKRVDSESVYRGNYQETEEYERARELVDQSYDLELSGKVREATEKYLTAHELQTQLCPSIPRDRYMSRIEAQLPEEIFVTIFSFLSAEEVVKVVLYLNRNINSMARNEALWKWNYDIKWPVQTKYQERVRSAIRSEYMNEGFSTTVEFVETYSKENQLIANMQLDTNWYHLFVTRANMENFFCPVILAPGSFSYRFGLSSSDSYQCSRSMCGNATMGHFYMPGYGYDDVLIGERWKRIRGRARRRPLFNPSGTIASFDNFAYLVQQLYEEELSISFEDHPLVICVPPSWSPQDQQEVLEILVS